MTEIWDPRAIAATAGPLRLGHFAEVVIRVGRIILSALLALFMLGIVPVGLARVQDQVECPPGFHLEGAKIITGHDGGPVLVGGHCVRDRGEPQPGAKVLFVDSQSSGEQDGTAEHPFPTVSQALAAAAPGDTIAIRSGTYTFQGGPLIFNKPVTVRADNGPVVIGTALTWFDAQTGRPTSNPAPYDLVTRAFDPDNGLPLNPFLGSQTWPSHPLADPALCGGGSPWVPPCTTQKTWIDESTVTRGICRGGGGPLPGHANWGLALYDGLIYFSNHSHFTQDDDYSFVLYRRDLAGMTKVDVDMGYYEGYLHSEFNSDETINHFHTWYWDTLHRAVDTDAGKGGILNGTPKPSYTATRPMVDGREAIVMGLYGLDCAHFCGAELHPVYAMAIHLNGSKEIDDDKWAIFVRNWGDEGYCSSMQEEINRGSPFQFSFRLKKRGATQVDIIPAQPSDTQGERGTVFLSNRGKDEISWSLGPIPNEGAIITFNLPPPSARGRINGMLHLKWTVAADQLTTQLLSVQKPAEELLASREVGEREDAEGGAMTELIQRLTPDQLTIAERIWRGNEPFSADQVRLAPVQGPAIPAPTSFPRWEVKQAADPEREERERRLQEAIQQMASPH